MAGLPGTGGRGLSLIGSLKAKRFQAVREGRSLGFLVAYIQALLELVKMIPISPPAEFFQKIHQYKRVNSLNENICFPKVVAVLMIH